MSRLRWFRLRSRCGQQSPVPAGLTGRPRSRSGHTHTRARAPSDRGQVLPRHHSPRSRIRGRRVRDRPAPGCGVGGSLSPAHAPFVLPFPDGHRGAHPLKAKIAPDRVRRLIERRVAALREAARERGRRAAAKSKETQDALASILRLDMDASMTCRETLCAVLAVEVRPWRRSAGEGVRGGRLAGARAHCSPHPPRRVAGPWQAPAAGQGAGPALQEPRTGAAVGTALVSAVVAAGLGEPRALSVGGESACAAHRLLRRPRSRAPLWSRTGKIWRRLAACGRKNTCSCSRESTVDWFPCVPRVQGAAWNDAEVLGVLGVTVPSTPHRPCASLQGPLRADRVGRAIEGAKNSPDQYLPPPRRRG